MTPLQILKGAATFSEDERHRYTLSRDLGSGSLSCLFLMLNPSTATATALDPTVRRCVGYAHRWGYEHLAVCNLFSLRSTDPKALYGDAGAEGDPRNIEVIVAAAKICALTVCAWGAHGKLRNRDYVVATRLRVAGVTLHHLGLTKDGQPRHPLYLPGDLKPTPWAQP